MGTHYVLSRKQRGKEKIIIRNRVPNRGRNEREEREEEGKFQSKLFNVRISAKLASLESRHPPFMASSLLKLNELARLGKVIGGTREQIEWRNTSAKLRGKTTEFIIIL